jgi:hypothetical protein
MRALRSITTAVLALGVVASLGGEARADDDYFIEPGHHRLGWYIGGGAGGSLLVGLGDYDSFGGTGGGVSLRVGTTATRQFLWILQLDVSSYIVQEITEEKRLNAQSILTLGGQLYAREKMWIKAGGGIASLREDFVEGSKSAADATGIGWMGSIGIDVVQRRRFVLDLELVVAGGVYRSGVVTQGGLKLAINWYGLRRED